MHWAAKEGDVDLAKLLLTYGAKVEGKTKNENTAFHIAAESKQIDIIRELLQHDKCHAFINAKNQEGKAPINLAILGGHADIICLLLDSGAELKDSEGKDIPLILATAQAGHIDAFKRALDKTGDLDQKSSYLNTTLQLSSKCGHFALVEYVLDNGADIETVDDNGQTPLFLVGEYPELTIMLLNRGADMEAKNHGGQTPLQHYAELGQIKSLAVLLSYGCNIQSIDKNGNTALHYACRNNQQEVLLLLLEKGIDTDDISEDGETALHIVIDKSFLNLVDLLINGGSDINQSDHEFGMTSLHLAVQQKNIEAVRLLLNRNADFGLVDGGGETALLHAVQRRLPEIATLLIERGVNVNMLTRIEATPLYFAVRDGDPVMVKILLDKGAQISNFNGNGFNSYLRKAIFFAKMRVTFSEKAKLREYIETIILLIKAGDDAPGIQVPEEWKNEFSNLSNAMENTQKMAQEIERADFYVSLGQTNALETMPTIGGMLYEYRGDFVNELESK